MNGTAGHLVELLIDGLGTRGDGLAHHEGAAVAVPLTLPGERWRVRLAPAGRGARLGEPLERLGGPPRALPPCRHFGECGGCTLQHLPGSAYAEVKLGRVRGALRDAGLAEPVILPLQGSPLGSRRRLRLLYERRGRAVLLGYRQRRRHAVTAVAVCPIARPELTALLPPLRALLAGLVCVGRSGEVRLDATEAGVDLLLEVAQAPGFADLERLAAFAEGRDLARLGLEVGGATEPVAVRRPPMQRLGDLVVPLPPGAFRQATAAGEAALRAAVGRWSGAARRVADLYAGLGTLSLGLAGRLDRLLLFERDAAAVAAVQAAARTARRPGIEVLRRDLDRDPLRAAELAAFDLALLDPPRAGAAAQARELAAAEVGSVVYASCNPATFARDARTLVASGWSLMELQPIDQFLFSPEIELVARFERR